MCNIHNHNIEQRPTCVNHGCNELVIFSHKGVDGKKRWRIHCWRCQKASYGAREHAQGVTPFKTGRCSNTDEHLGFRCPINYEAAEWMIGVTEVDHIDGNYFNNDLSNLDELCPCCHRQKGKLAGDYSKTKKVRAF